jgi:hypothetical protein
MKDAAPHPGQTTPKARSHLVESVALSISLCFALLTASGQLARAEGWTYYPHPSVPVFQEGDRDLDCIQLEAELSALEPLTYSYKPGFYDDPAHGAAIWTGVLASPAFTYLAYSGVAEYYEEQRMHEARERIDVLRRLKAHRRCFEQ